MAVLKGYDISHYQKTTPLDGDFLIIKATEGNGYVDEMLDTHYNTMVANKPDMKYGFYHFARPDLGNSPEAEADWFLSKVGHHAKKCIFALDLESPAISYSDYANWARKWLDYVYNKTGVKPLIYIQGSISKTCANKIASGDYGLWAASDPAWYVDWKFIIIQQQVYNNLDHDTFYGDTSVWDAYCGKDGATNTTPNSSEINLDQYTDEQLADMVMDDKFGKVPERAEKLGSRFTSVQAIVNERIYGNKNVSYTGSVYTVKTGDTLSQIAEWYGTTVSELARINNIADPNVIYPNQKIIVNSSNSGNVQILKVGSSVKIKSGATDLNTGKGYANFVYNTTYTVKSISGDRVVFGTSSGTTGATSKSNIIIV